ncbi:hypothetical protein B14911_08892 [Bacillus sp. NRRL B-14911]|uniref:Uncharacterized protein n=1 Tax=Bacillus infantis NRRL B-14911 TaxID=1367477 RepID=U5LFG1_9BACI|nr:hypothetical protein N288_17210 [Bacillus infantis NRRL B-14911]EAR65356.1 hypothetical protein B14911_08892 [Bacillus sp. NRRL B-14911]
MQKKGNQKVLVKRTSTLYAGKRGTEGLSEGDWHPQLFTMRLMLAGADQAPSAFR